MERRFFIAAMIILTAAFIMSCTDDTEVNNGGQEKQAIMFTVDDSQDWMQSWVDTRSVMKATRLPLTEKGEATHLVLCASMEAGGKDNAVFPTNQMTRGIAHTSLYNYFTVVAYSYDVSTQWGSVARLYQSQVTASGDMKTWTMTGGAYYWEAGKTMRFVGFATETGVGLDSTGVTIAGYPYIDYTVRENVADQEDLMTAISQPCTYSSTAGKVIMPFKHALTAVRFAIGDYLEPGIVINRISLKNIARKGRVTIDEQVQWSNTETLTQFNIIDMNYTVPTSSAGTIIKPSNDNDAEKKATLLMIPQEFSEGQEASVEISYTDGSGAHTVSASLDGQAWLPGTIVTYKLSVNDNSLKYTFMADPAITIGHTGGTTTFNVTSYSETHDGLNKKALPWSVIGYSVDGGHTFTPEKPKSLNWLGIATTSGNGSTNGETGTLIITPQTASSSEVLTTSNAMSKQAEILQNNPTRGTQQNYYDLSTHDLAGNETPRNTANCYIVNGQGYYKIPLFYGNIIKDGKVQTNIINRNPFFNYKMISQATSNNSNRITAPEISTDGTPSSCILCWQDANNLVSDVGLSEADADGMRYLTFKVGGDIAPGNAVVAVRDDNNTIMWSWHIWVTPIDIMATKEVKNYQNYIYDMMTVNLGFIVTGGRMDVYEGHEVYVKLLQEDSGLTTTFKIVQNQGVAFDGVVSGYCPFYQFGRKDPMLPSNGISSSNHDQYNGVKLWTKETGPVYLGTAIRNPNKYYSNTAAATPPNMNWSTVAYLNLWNVQDVSIVGFSNKKVVKSVYDPCPVGFSVPPSGVFSGFTKTGENVETFTNTTQINVKGGFQTGWEFYTGIDTKTIYFHCIGYRTNDGSFTQQGTYGHCWTAMPGSENSNYAVRFRYDETNILVGSEVQRSNAFGIRPIREQ